MSLNRRIFLYFLGAFFVLICVIGFFQHKREKEFRTEQLDQLLSTYNHSIFNYINNQTWTGESLAQFVRLFPDTTMRVTIIDELGNVIFDNSIKSTIHIENHLHRPEIEQALSEGSGKAIRLSHTIGLTYYYYANRFENYYIRTALPYNLNLLGTLKANTSFIYFMSITFLLATLLLFFLAKRFTASIDRLRTFTQKVENGEEIEVDIKFPNDELGEISNYIVELYRRILRSKKELKNEREKLIKHLQISQEGLGIFSAEKKELLVNSHFIQYSNTLLGLQAESSDEIFQLPEFKEINHFIDRSFYNNQLTRKKILIEKNGKVFMVRCIVFQDNSFEVSINDVTVQEKENELKRHLTQNISHELKTPVSSILGYMESILQNPDITPERQNFFVERSYQQALRLTSLLHDISTLNKIEEANKLFEKSKCNLSLIIDDVINDVQLEIEKKNSEVQRNYSKELLIEGNRSLLYSIFRNLIDNALAYAGDKVRITIECYREDDAYYYFSFSDNGVGISDDAHLSKLFERFYRVDKGRSRKVGGTGLGLSIVKNAVLFHKGNIFAKSVPTGGLSFVFSLKKL